jgi:hypothetical protein
MLVKPAQIDTGVKTNNEREFAAILAPCVPFFNSLERHARASVEILVGEPTDFPP